MIDFSGVTGKLKFLKDNWTAARAAKLDFITAGVAVASTALSSSTWTSARAAALDAVVQDTEPLISPPILTGWQTPANGHANWQGAAGVGADFIAAACGGTVHTVAGTTLTNAVNITGSGVLNLVCLAANAQPAFINIYVDGVALVSGATCIAGSGKSYIGSGCFDGSAGYAALDQIPFRASLQIQHKSTVAGGTSYVAYKYRRTA